MASPPRSLGPEISGLSGLTAKGITPQTAIPLSAQFVSFATVAAGAYARLPGANSNELTVYDDDASNNLFVIPEAGDRIGTNAVDAAVTVTAGTGVKFATFDTPLTPKPRTWHLMQPGAGGGGTALSVNDGTTTVANVGTIAFTGATVAAGGAATANVTIPAPGGGTTVIAGSGIAVTSGNTVALGTITAGDILGNSGTIGATPTGVAIGANLTLAGGTLSASAGGGGIGTIIAAGQSSSANPTVLPYIPPISVPAAAGFSYINQNGATIADNANGPLTFSTSATNGTNSLSAATKPVSASFTLTINATVISNKSFGGFGVTDGTKFHILLKNQADAGLYVQRYSNTTTFSSSDVGPLFANNFINPGWFRIIWNSGTTTITFQVSCDGITWTTLYTTATPYLTPTAAGLIININQSSGFLSEIAVNHWDGL